MELTTEDRQRIEQEAKEFYSHWGAGYNEWIKGAEYATLYERAQLAEEIRGQRNKVRHTIGDFLSAKGTYSRKSHRGEHRTFVLYEDAVKAALEYTGQEVARIAQAPDLLAKVSEQEKEIEKLKKSVMYWEKLAQTGASMIDEVKDIEISEQYEEINRLREEKERMLKSIGNMLTALNQCGPEIGWNTSNYIEEAYAEHRKIFEASISPSSQTEL